jgi:GTP:adenosylcobinamide-phosphate guanylyltransferase
MAIFIDASEARFRAENDSLITSQISIMEMAILAAIASNQFTVNVTHNSTVSINGTTITGSPMTMDTATGLAYWNVWQDNTTDNVKKAQMDAVINYFEDLKYSITRVTAQGTTNAIFYWQITW